MIGLGGVLWLFSLSPIDVSEGISKGVTELGCFQEEEIAISFWGKLFIITAEWPI
jgi:hypothetical protein